MKLIQKKKTPEYFQRSHVSNFQENNIYPDTTHLFIDEQCPVRNKMFSMWTFLNAKVYIYIYIHSSTEHENKNI